MSPTEAEQALLARLRQLIVSLPYDLRIPLEMVEDDELPEPVRLLAAEIVIYCLTTHKVTHDSQGLIRFVDHAVLLRWGLARLLADAGNQSDYYREKFQSELASLNTDLNLLQSCFDPDLLWLDEFAKERMTGKYKGWTVDKYMVDEQARQQLFDDAQNFLTDFEVDEFTAQKLASLEPTRALYQLRTKEMDVRRRAP